MKLKLVLVYILCLVAVTVYADEPLLIASSNAYVLGAQAEAPGDTYADILFWWRCEGTTIEADDYSAGDTTATNEDGTAINTTAVKIGTNGLHAANGWDRYSFAVSSSDIIKPDEGRIGFWLNVITWADNSPVFDVGGDALRLFLFNSDELYAEYNGDTGALYGATSAANLSTTNWYFVEMAWKASTNLLKIYIDGSEKFAAIQSCTAKTSSYTVVQFGNTSGLAAQVYMDNIILSNSSVRDLFALRNLTASPK